MNGKQNHQQILVEFYLPAEQVDGYVSISARLRLLDLLNRAGAADSEAYSEYIEVSPMSTEIEDDVSKKQYVKKSTIELAAVLNPESARGFGGKCKTYPFVEKQKTLIRVNTVHYSLRGTTFYPCEGNLLALLDEGATFLPLVNVTLTGMDGKNHVRPFVAVGKAWISSVEECCDGEGMGSSPAMQRTSIEVVPVAK